MFRTGWWRVGAPGGVTLRVHWTLVVGALVFGELRIRPAFWIGFVALVAWHELGHAAVARLRGRRVRAIDVTGLGGVCHLSGSASELDRAWCAWGGVLAQLALFLVVGLPLWLSGLGSTWGQGGWGSELLSLLVVTNLLLVALNLLPFAPLDGAEAWRLVRVLRQRRTGAARGIGKTDSGRRARRVGPVGLSSPPRSEPAASSGATRPGTPPRGVRERAQPRGAPATNGASRVGARGGNRENGENANEERAATRDDLAATPELAEMFERIAEAARKARKN